MLYAETEDMPTMLYLVRDPKMIGLRWCCESNWSLPTSLYCVLM
jgi:hypothetical protein